MSFKVKDMALADEGRLSIEWSQRNMPVLSRIAHELASSRELEGLRVAACLHITKETAGLVLALQGGGAEVALCPSNPLSTQDDVAAALADQGIKVYGWKGLGTDDYYWCIRKASAIRPHILLDDGADLISHLHREDPPWIGEVMGGQEETTTGVIRFRAMERDGILKFPVIAVNDAKVKWDMDNVFGTGQSALHGILNGAKILIAGKTVVVCGYGHCGRGIAMRARGLGARVIVTEIDPHRALNALLEGYGVMKMEEAAPIGDLFITATGNRGVIRREHMERMKDGAILANAGHFNVEISMEDLDDLTKAKRSVQPMVEERKLKNRRTVMLLADGRLVNLALAFGHPSEVMDMSFSVHALTLMWLRKAHDELDRGRVHSVPSAIDDAVASRKLDAMGIRIDVMTEEQRQYVTSWELGT
jgi:adenosylhomocysteinase